MSIPRSVAEVIRDHVTLEVEGIDRLYLNVYQPKLQTEKQAACFFRFHRGQPVASSSLMGVMTNDFLSRVDAFIEQHQIPVVHFKKNQRKDDVAAEYRARFPGTEGVLFLGKAQENVTVFRTEKRTDATGKKYAWLVKSATPVKQYHKEGRALRTETTINNARDFAIGKRLPNLPALREIGFQANRHLLDVQRLSHDCTIGEDAFRQLNEPVTVAGQRASALRFADPRVLTLFCALLVFRLLPRGFSHRELRNHWAPLQGKKPQSITPGQMTYHLRRLRLHGLIARVPKSHRYRLTDAGWRLILFCTRSYHRLLRPGLAQIMHPEATRDNPLNQSFARLDAALDQWIQEHNLAA